MLVWRAESRSRGGRIPPDKGGAEGIDDAWGGWRGGDDGDTGTGAHIKYLWLSLMGGGSTTTWHRIISLPGVFVDIWRGPPSVVGREATWGCGCAAGITTTVGAGAASLCSALAARAAGIIRAPLKLWASTGGGLVLRGR